MRNHNAPPTKIWRRLLAWTATLVLRLLRASWRVRIVGAPAGSAPALCAFWHGDQLALTAALARVLPVTVLASRSRDGALAAAVVGACADKGIIPGVALWRFDSRRATQLLVCATEVHSRAQIDRLAAAVSEVTA